VNAGLAVATLILAWRVGRYYNKLTVAGATPPAAV
jgi:hypothetical protein